MFFGDAMDLEDFCSILVAFIERNSLFVDLELFCEKAPEFLICFSVDRRCVNANFYRTSVKTHDFSMFGTWLCVHIDANSALARRDSRGEFAH